MSVLSPLLDSLAFPAAVYGTDGALQAANDAFRALIAPMLPPEHSGGLADLADLGTSLGLSLTQTGTFEAVSGSGQVTALTLTAIATGGWSLCAEDVTLRRRIERKAERSQKIALIALADLAENRDNETGEHVLRVARLTHEMARCLKARGHYAHIIDDIFLRHVGVASILHDVGKVAIPDSILLKPGPLTPDERATMECHAARGGAILRKADSMLAGSNQFHLAAEIAEFHHERWNGAGYPHGLAGEAIPLAARIVSAADVLDALTSARPYKVAWPLERALGHLQERSGVDFDPLVVEALAEVIDARSRTRTIEWTSAMAVGEPSIDQDHRVLLALVNQVSSPATMDDPIAVEFVLDELLGYTALHFAREESLMERAGYPDLAEHKATHKSMIAEVRQLQRRMTSIDGNSASPKLGQDLQRFLAEWLTQHILTEDRQYMPYLWSDDVSET